VRRQPHDRRVCRGGSVVYAARAPGPGRPYRDGGVAAGLVMPGDFVLRVDDDERLGGDWDKKYFEFLVRCNDITHFWTPCRWVVPPGDQFIASPPWFPDLHMRLYLNNLLIISCPNRIHECLRVEGRPLVL